MSKRPFGDRRSLLALRDWLRHDPPAISRIAAQAIHDAKGIELLLQGDVAALPISTSAADEFTRAIADPELPTDPKAFIDMVNRLCWRLAVFRQDDVSCPVCQGDLELWTDGSAWFDICDLLGCCFDRAGRPVPTVAGLRPATRDEVLACLPDARLVPVT